MPSDRKNDRDADQQIAVTDSFPASDPPSDTGESGPRAVPPGELIGRAHPPRQGAVLLQRRFADQESAKLALEALVRDGPLDPEAADLRHEGAEVELRIMAPPADADRLRRLLMGR
jgi:hypothetical protein